MITRWTCKDEDDVRHDVFILSGYPAVATACGRSVPRHDLDKEAAPVTCMACVARMAAMGQ